MNAIRKISYFMRASCVKFTVLFVAAAFMGIGCDSGNGGTPTSVISSGVFVDSPVKGLEYKTATREGLTETDGSFRYADGETVAFYIGNIFLGETAAKGVITPIDLIAGAVDETEPTVTNICRLLQSLDQDGNPDNGITISAETRRELKDRPIDLELSVSDFENDTDVQSLFNVLNALGIFSHEEERTLIPAEQARSHLRITLAKRGDGNDPIEIDQSPDEEPRRHDRIITQRQWAYAERSEIKSLVLGLNSLAFDMYHQFQEDGKNLFFSPYVISRAMAMTLTGANNETATQLQDSLQYTLDYGRLHSVFNALDLKLDAQRFAGDGHSNLLILNTEAGAWGQSGYFVPISYYNTLAADYGAALKALDFQNQAFDADRRIEAWIAKQTDDTLSDAISSITARVRFALANTLNLNAEWAQPFDFNFTVDGDFELTSGSSVSVPMMSITGQYLSVIDAGYEAIEIPFANSSLAMLIILPDSGKFGDFEETFDVSVFQAILESLEQQSITLTMPKFSYSSGRDLVNAFSQFGITKATVESEADFSRINVADNLYINGGLIRASISVNETEAQGACAAAITIEGQEDIPEYNLDFPVIEIGSSSYFTDIGLIFFSQEPLNTEKVALGRPFIYLVHDKGTGIVLFIGRVLDPSIQSD